MNNKTKELREKIEEIMSKGTWEEAGDFYNMYFVLEHDFPKLLTLISQSQVEAVEGFLTWFNQKSIEGGVEVLIDLKLAQEYLDTLSKEEIGYLIGRYQGK